MFHVIIILKKGENGPLDKCRNRLGARMLRIGKGHMFVYHPGPLSHHPPKLPVFHLLHPLHTQTDQIPIREGFDEYSIRQQQNTVSETVGQKRRETGRIGRVTTCSVRVSVAIRSVSGRTSRLSPRRVLGSPVAEKHGCGRIEPLAADVDVEMGLCVNRQYMNRHPAIVWSGSKPTQVRVTVPWLKEMCGVYRDSTKSKSKPNNHSDTWIG
ncbi:hypothetical protein QBC47DRAFT_26409 [Echria macrotheca]|uniref:Uncharacterized protein n=1 Tax=Echria macrotheca TaxID=438768 RepID=A0AAJ0BNC0_9PEZI|nr:hypothetical protein QBC47DRAFT_26409 [Echria macrotheca]